MNKPIVLVILDGWGLAPPGPGNAISLSKTPTMNSLWADYTHTQLIAHGQSVGLPQNEAGNTETGHLNIGAGRIVYQDLPRINMSLADGSFFQNAAFIRACNHTKERNSTLHLIGLLGEGGVHSDKEHLYALLRLAQEQHVPKVVVHVFTDGRDSAPDSAKDLVGSLEKYLNEEKAGVIGSVMGRYYAMDRDSRWERTAKAYFALTQGKGDMARSATEAIIHAYASGLTDEFIKPTIVVTENGQPTGLIKSSDAVIFYNFRIDRPRQLTKAFVLDDFQTMANLTDFDPYATKYGKTHVQAATMQATTSVFDRGAKLNDLFFVSMTEYAKNIPSIIAFPPTRLEATLGEMLARMNMTQLRISESEKERFVTYYFNGQNEQAYPGEERSIVPSPKVPTYDKQPEMAAKDVTAKILAAIESQKYDFVIANFANADMVGHTGNLKACIKACETVDMCLGQIVESVLKHDAVLAITADHGNAEELLNPFTKSTDTEHNANPVPFILVSKQTKDAKVLPQGVLGDIAPTLLSLVGINPPVEMVGRNLLRV